MDQNNSSAIFNMYSEIVLQYFLPIPCIQPQLLTVSVSKIFFDMNDKYWTLAFFKSKC